MARFLITGGAGFIGSHLCAALLARGDEAVVLDDLSTGARDNPPPECRLMVGDVADPGAVREAAEGVDGVFHLGAIASVPACNERWRASHRVNAGGAVAVFEAARDIGRAPVVYASSSAVYGDAQTHPINETAPTRPLSLYGADKLACELHAAPAAALFDLPSAGLRLFNIYGPRQRADSPYSGVIALFTRRLSAGAGVTINGDGEQVRDFVFVADAVRAFMAAMDRLRAGQASGAPAEALIANVCTGRPTSILTLAEVLRRTIGSTSPIDHGPDRPGDIKRSIGDPTRMRAALGLQAETTIEQGVAALLAAGPQ